MLTLYQLHDLVVYHQGINSLLIDSWHGDNVGFEVSGIIPYASDRVRINDKHRSPNISNRVITARLWPIDEYSTDGFVQSLLWMNGKTIPIFAFEQLNDFCGTRMSRPSEDILWFQTNGRFWVDVSQGNNPIPEIDITLEFEAYWKPVNRLLWEFDYHPNHTAVEIATAPLIADPDNNLAPLLGLYPNSDAFKGLGWSWRRRKFDDPNIMYNPNMWSYIWDTPTVLGYPQVASMTMIEDFGEYTFTTPDYWSAPPLSVYYLTPLPAATTFTFQITRQSGRWGTFTESVVIQTNSIIAELPGGLVAGDVFVFGDMPSKSFNLLRNGIFIELENIMSAFYGAVYAGKNRVSFDLLGGVLYVLNIFRRF